MDRQASEDSESRFARYVEGLTSVIGHADRAAPLRDYCVGLLAADGRQSVEPMAAVTAPAGPRSRAYVGELRVWCATRSELHKIKPVKAKYSFQFR
jgi:SRSO17 transposase